MLNTAKSQPLILGMFVLIFIIVNKIANSLDQAQETKCLGCIRNVSSLMGIDTSKRCENYYCGQFQLSYTYWAEAGKPGNNQSSRDYEKCARDKTCAEQAVRSYFKKFKRDCNNDGVIDCLDMAALHKGGPASCASDWFYKSRYWLAFNKTTCMTNRDLDNPKSDFGEQSNQPIRMMKNQTLTSECLDCICDAISGCNTNASNCASGTVCGPFAISQAFWKDGRKPGASWTACAKTKECSSVTMKNYMEKYMKDCNGDGFITCEDYAAIHRRGPRGCSSKDLLKDRYWNKFLACRANQKPVKDVNLVKVSNSVDDSETQSSLASQGDTLMISSTLPPIIEPAQNSLDKSSTSSSFATTLQSISSSSPSSERFDYSQTPTYEQTSIINAREDNLTRRPNVRPTTLSSDRNYNYPQQSTAQVQNSEFVRHKPEQAPEYNPSSKQNHRVTSISSITIQQSESTGDISEQPSENSARPTKVSGKPMASSPTTMIATQAPATTGTVLTSSSLRPTSTPQFQPLFTRQHAHADGHLAQNSHNEDRAPIKQHQVIVQKIDHQSATKPAHSLPSFSSLDQSISQPIHGEEIDFSVSDFPFSVQDSANGASRANFDKVVIDIVGNPEFSKSYPPIPELTIQDKQTEPQDEQQYPLASKSQQRVNTNHSRNPNQANRAPTAQVNQVHSNDSSVSQNNINRSSNQPNNVSQAQRGTAGQQQQQERNPELDLGSVLQPINMSGLFGLGLNESSRISGECLECICDASSNCDTTVQCISKQREKNRCGLYMISWNQYQESDISLTSLVPVPAGMSEETADEKMYYECTTDKVCAEKLIHLYIEKHQKDCNNDGKIDCYDIAALHRVGPDNCNSGKFLASQYWRDFNICYTTDRLTTTIQPQPPAQLNR